MRLGSAQAWADALRCCSLRIAHSALRIIPIILVFLGCNPASAWLINKTYQATPTIEAEWMFPIGGGQVWVQTANQQGGLELRVWARDLDYWTAIDDSNYNPFDTWRWGWEADTLTYTWTASKGTIYPGGLYYPPLTPGWGSATVTVAINDTDTPGRNDDQVTLQTTVTEAQMGDWKIRSIGASSATSGHAYETDPSHRSYLTVQTVPCAIWLWFECTTDFGSASGWGPGPFKILIPASQEHKRYTVTVKMYSGPGGRLWDVKVAAFYIFFHHCCHVDGWSHPFYDEVDPDSQGWSSPPNWFEGLSPPPDEDAHWHSLVDAATFAYREEMQFWHPQFGWVETIGCFDPGGSLGGARGQLYIGEQKADNLAIPGSACHFWEGEDTSWDASHAGGNDWILGYYGIDLAGKTVKHERRHKWLWEQPDNWGDDYSVEDLQRAGSGVEGWDWDADRISDNYELNHPPHDRRDLYSLNDEHNGARQYPDDEFDAIWSGERSWEIGSKWPQDWSGHGAQRYRY